MIVEGDGKPGLTGRRRPRTAPVDLRDVRRAGAFERRRLDGFATPSSPTHSSEPPLANPRPPGAAIAPTQPIGIIHATAMPHRSPYDLARMLAAVRIAAGLAFAVAPGRAGSLLVGDDARAPGARLFIRAFGARDVLLGSGTRHAIGGRGAVRPWLFACALADAFDAAATLAQFHELPRRRRTLTFAVSLAPALAGAAIARRVKR